MLLIDGHHPIPVNNLTTTVLKVVYREQQQLKCCKNFPLREKVSGNMLGTKPVYTLTVNLDNQMLPYNLPPVLIIPTAPTTVEIYIIPSKMTGSNAITLPVVNILLGA